MITCFWETVKTASFCKEANVENSKPWKQQNQNISDTLVFINCSGDVNKTVTCLLKNE